ncbi:pectinesterase inhibitor-like [Quercus robur]|uniref:pectinesterase inhibitor-like n=1 Tax=Quercus robur TaxID=38942 RepID=UPI002162C5C4|nr:pectinesterase inhibitor-like [Quercus robur]
MKIVAYSYLCLSLLFAVSIFIQPSYAAAAAAAATTAIQPTNLVKKVCSQTSNYNFCVETLYADPRTPEADRYVLAYVIFGSAYQSATTTHDRINLLLKNATASQMPRLKRCDRDYTKAVSKLLEAHDDLDSETFDSLAKLSRIASSAAADCETSFKGTRSPLTTNNKGLKGLCEICAVVSKLFVMS